MGWWEIKVRKKGDRIIGKRGCLCLTLVNHWVLQFCSSVTLTSSSRHVLVNICMLGGDTV